VQHVGRREARIEEAVVEPFAAVVLMANLDAAQTNDRRAALVALRDSLAAAMDGAEPNVMAQIAGQYRATLKELAELPEAKPDSVLQQATKERSKRRANLKAV
jgi:hypothetical protein